MSNQKLKPFVDRFEASVFIIIIALSAIVIALEYSQEYSHLPFRDSILLYSPFVGLAIALVFVIHRRNRENKWKDKQQSQTQYTLQN